MKSNKLIKDVKEKENNKIMIITSNKKICFRNVGQSPLSVPAISYSRSHSRIESGRRRPRS